MICIYNLDIPHFLLLNVVALLLILLHTIAGIAERKGSQSHVDSRHVNVSCRRTGDREHNDFNSAATIQRSNFTFQRRLDLISIGLFL